MSKILIIGGNSDIGQEIALFLVQEHEVSITLHKPLLKEIPNCKTIQFNVLNFNPDQFNFDYDIILYIAGKFSSAAASITQPELNEILEVNYNAPVRILSEFAKRFNDRGFGTIAGVTSVAAVRGKASTVVYGSAKAGLDNFLAGLRSYYFPKVKVITFRLGYVNTKMTKGLDLPSALTSSPAKAGKIIAKHLIRGSRHIVYVAPIFRPIAFVIKSIPEGILKRLRL